MSDRTVVHLVRHGEVYNPTKVLYGRLPGFRLSDHGVEQADRVAHFLVGRDVAAVIASPWSGPARPPSRSPPRTVSTSASIRG